MSRRAALPGADELFRATSTAAALAEGTTAAAEATPAPVSAAAVADEPSTRPTPLRRVPAADHRSSGRERHDEKITVYLSPEELVALEDARMTLYRDHGLKVDRGRVVREAIALVLAELAAKGTGSVLVKRLHER